VLDCQSTTHVAGTSCHSFGALRMHKSSTLEPIDSRACRSLQGLSTTCISSGHFSIQAQCLHVHIERSLRSKDVSGRGRLHGDVRCIKPPPLEDRSRLRAETKHRPSAILEAVSIADTLDIWGKWMTVAPWAASLLRVAQSSRKKTSLSSDLAACGERRQRSTNHHATAGRWAISPREAKRSARVTGAKDTR
jgi:hypothetical protein